MKKIVLFAAVLALAFAASGCESQSTTVEATSSAPSKDTVSTEVTVAATATPAPTEAPAEELVEMQVTNTDNSIQNVVGEKTDTAKNLIVVNQTGGTVSEFFVRRHPNDDDEEEWGQDLIQTRFTLPSGERMLYYYQGGTTANLLYDLRISYTDPDRSVCYFRSIPLETISQITLRMDGQDEDAIPYATYMTANNQKEYSTLNEVKRRIGLLDSEDDRDDEDDDEDPTPTPTPVPEDDDDDIIDIGDINDEDSHPQTDAMTTAASYVGQSLSSLEGAVGSPNGSDYEDEPETGRTGYHYYGSFTVSTTVDDSGNEIVTGIW